MKRIHVYPVALALLALGGFAACNHHEDVVGETRLTSAALDPTDRSGVAQVPAAAATTTDEVATPRVTRGAKDGGALITDTTTKAPATIPTPAIGNGAAVDPDRDFGGVAPGHIMFPPGSAKGTGEPNSEGSHGLGTGNGTPR